MESSHKKKDTVEDKRPQGKKEIHCLLLGGKSHQNHPPRFLMFSLLPSSAAQQASSSTGSHLLCEGLALEINAKGYFALPRPRTTQE